jgi:hypothetical protein
MITYYLIKLYTFLAKKKINKIDFFLSKSMPNFNFAELICFKHSFRSISCIFYRCRRDMGRFVRPWAVRA